METEGKNINKGNESHPQEQEIDLYIGIFFDGTNNNKFQTMLGKVFRRKKILEEIVAAANSNIYSKDQLSMLLIEPNPIIREKTQNKVGMGSYTHYQVKKYEANISPNELTKYYKAIFWKFGNRNNGDKGILTKSQFDQLFFGYEEGEKSDFMEELMLSQLKERGEGQNSRKLSSIPDEKGTDSIMITAKQYVEENDNKEVDDSLEGDFAQGATYTNVAIMEGLYHTQAPNHYSIYVEGSGSNMEIYPEYEKGKKEFYAWMIRSSAGVLHPALSDPLFDVAATPLSLWGVDKLAEATNLLTKVGGLAFGCTDSGVLGKTKKASMIVKRIIGDKKNIKIHFDLFGFSRGATAARAFNYAINARNDAVKDCDFEMIMGSNNYLSKKHGQIKEKEVRFLGIFDTVSSIGVAKNNGVLETVIASMLKIGCESCRKYDKSPYHEDNVNDFGLYATDQANKVFHICALDEYRQNFALVDIEESIETGNGMELFLPGCHTDIGGGISLGREETYVVNTGSLSGTPNYICERDPFNQDNMTYSPVSPETMIEIGWLKQNQETKDKTLLRGKAGSNALSASDDTVFTVNDKELFRRNNIIMNRYVMPGYSNIGLELMVCRGNIINVMFNNVPKSYTVPEKLKDFCKEVQEIVKEEEKIGRYFVYPNRTLYKKLRSNYLHYSANDQIISKANNLLVNPPAYINASCNANVETVKGTDVDTNNSSLPNLDESILYAINNTLVPHSMSIVYWAASKLKKYYMGKKNIRLSTRVIYPGIQEKSDDHKFMFNYMPDSSHIIPLRIDAIPIKSVKKQRASKENLLYDDSHIVPYPNRLDSPKPQLPKGWNCKDGHFDILGDE